jgi:hypothetical protein
LAAALARSSAALLERACGNQPPVQRLTTHAERMLQVLMRTGAITVERNGEGSNAQLCHESFLRAVELLTLA